MGTSEAAGDLDCAPQSDVGPQLLQRLAGYMFRYLIHFSRGTMHRMVGKFTPTERAHTIA